MKRVVVLGASGSIGTKAVSYLQEHTDTFQLVGVSLHSSYESLQDTFDCPVFHSKAVDVSKFKLFLQETMPDIVLNAIAGFAGLPFSLKIAEMGINLALANKETIICGGKWFMEYAKRHNCLIIPVDSEHSSIFQCIGYNTDNIETITITASGGPFWQRMSLEHITLQDALQHPTWRMGPKITIDSATLVNKCMELIEAMILFDISFDHIKAIIEPTSNIHSIISLQNNMHQYISFPPDMIYPISYALTYPEKTFNDTTLISAKTDLKFFTINKDTFRIFRILDQYKDTILQHSISLNAANEVAVQAYLHEKIEFTQIYDIIENVLVNSPEESVSSYSDIVRYDTKARKLAYNYV